MTTVLALILWSRPAAAQEPIPVTLAQAESAAIGSTAPVIAQAEAAARSAHAGVGAAWAIEDPVVSVGATRYSAQRTYGVGVLLPVFGQSIPAIHAARQDADAADLEVDLARLEARSEVDGAWFWLWAAQQSADVFRSSQDDAVRLRDAVKARFDAGDVPKSDLLAAESRLARATAEASGAQATERSASAQLAALVGMDPAQVLVADPAGVDPIGGELPPLDGLIASLSNHPELAAAVHRQEAARARTRAARADWLPLLGIDLGMDQGDPGLPGTDLSATASIAVPIGGRHGAEVAAARADADADAAALEQTRARATADLVSAWYDADAARAKLVALDSVALPAASSAAELAATAYTAGEIDLPAVLASRQELADVRVERVQALIDAVNARAALARAAGGDPHAPLF